MTPPPATARPPQPDARLRAAADWVEPCGICADIGCDHGRLGATLLLENRCEHLLASDLSAPALQKAIGRLTRLGLAPRVTFAVADGLDALDALPQGRADTLCILGMGGETIRGLLVRGRARLQGATLVLGAHTELPRVREALVQVGYQIDRECVVAAQGRLYMLLRAMPAAADAAAYSERELLLGPCLLATLPAAWKPWLLQRLQLLERAIAAMEAAGATREAERLALWRRELGYTQEALLALEEARP